MYRFNFNLLPEKPKEEIEKEAQRENTSLYLAIFPLITVVIGIVLMFINFYIVSNPLKSWQDSVAKSEQDILNFLPVIRQNVEYAAKTDLLAEAVSKDVEPKKFFEISDSILGSLPFSATIQRYGRDADGSFLIVLDVDQTLDKTSDILTTFEKHPEIKLASTDGLTTKETATGFELTVRFYLNTEEDNG